MLSIWSSIQKYKKCDRILSYYIWKKLFIFSHYFYTENLLNTSSSLMTQHASELISVTHTHTHAKRLEIPKFSFAIMRKICIIRSDGIGCWPMISFSAVRMIVSYVYNTRRLMETAMVSHIIEKRILFMTFVGGGNKSSCAFNTSYGLRPQSTLVELFN